ncbi:MAG TPA: MarR family winged helix-turn-helix transcriptional regulator [Burkholderiaceae bacterium]|nr:MarR family winged helix-turn-helix transcriptional regulator [Burkholderiaceae bacterium]
MKESQKHNASQLEDHLGYWLRFISNHVSRRFQQLLEDQGTSVTEWVALRALFEQAETSHAELIQRLGMTKGGASKIVSRLEEKGLAQRRLAENAQREQVLSLTREGQALVPKLSILADQNDAHFFGHLPADQRKALRDLLETLVVHHRLQEVPVT